MAQSIPAKSLGAEIICHDPATGEEIGRAPLTIRFRADFAKALKHASLERQMKGVEPYKLQDILEQVVEPWLRNNGYLN